MQNTVSGALTGNGDWPCVLDGKVLASENDASIPHLLSNSSQEANPARQKRQYSKGKAKHYNGNSSKYSELKSTRKRGIPAITQSVWGY